MEIKVESKLTARVGKRPGKKVDPNRPPKRPPTYLKGVLRPHLWNHPDPEIHIKYHPWQMAKAQAVFRKEPWDLSFEEYCAIWQDHWHNRGRCPENVCMTRRDEDIGWDFENIEIITRKEHFQRGAERRKLNCGRPRKHKYETKAKV